jgi:hypothetical protein
MPRLLYEVQEQCHHFLLSAGREHVEQELARVRRVKHHQCGTKQMTKLKMVDASSMEAYQLGPRLMLVGRQYE